VKTIVHRKIATVLIYLSAAAVASGFMVEFDIRNGTRGEILLYWLALSAVPLLFVFAYPRYLFADPATQEHRQRFAAAVNGIGATAGTLFFPFMALPFWENPMHDVDSMALLLLPLLVLPIFLVAALFLLLRNKSSLAIFASLLFWPYWFVYALANLNRWFEGSSVHAAFYFLCFISPVLFAFSAGALPYRPALAHSAALLGVLSAPWVYWSVRNSVLGNVWITFNAPDRELPHFSMLRNELIIFAVLLIVLATTVAAFRLLPAHWKLGKLPLREQTWPAIAISIIVLACWFSQSVLPYRLSGAVRRSGSPILQILHVEKHGLQFHESCVSVWAPARRPLSVSFSGNDRRLFQYRFQQEYASGQILPEPLAERVRAMVHPDDRTNKRRDEIKPLRAWNVEGWYFTAEGAGLQAYTTNTGSTPPQEIIDLFWDLEKLPRSTPNESDLKDVCLGFCYDPLSGLGYLYAGDRCFYNGNDIVCR
jgi:hypothetical protein